MWFGRGSFANGLLSGIPLILFGCGGSDVTTIGEFAAPGGGETSRTLTILAEPESLDAACRLIGVSSQSVTGVAGGDAASCARIVEQCRDTVDDVMALRQQTGDDAAVAAAAPGGDLQALLGCPVTFVELDGCVAQILERGRDSYAGDVSCETTTLPEVDPAFLLTVPACFGVVLRCPELLSLGELFQAEP